MFVSIRDVVCEQLKDFGDPIDKMAKNISFSTEIRMHITWRDMVLCRSMVLRLQYESFVRSMLKLPWVGVWP